MHNWLHFMCSEVSKGLALFGEQYNSELFERNGSLNFTRCEIVWLCKQSFFFFFPEMLRVFVSLFKKKKRKACKWIMSIGWTAHLTGVLGIETLRWFTIWGKQIGSDNTGWSMPPISPAGNVLGRQGNDFCKHFLEFWVSCDPTPLFSWRNKNWGSKHSLSFVLRNSS